MSITEVRWDFSATNVWLDYDGDSMSTPLNEGVTTYPAFYEPPGAENSGEDVLSFPQVNNPGGSRHHIVPAGFQCELVTCWQVWFLDQVWLHWKL